VGSERLSVRNRRRLVDADLTSRLTAKGAMGGV